MQRGTLTSTLTATAVDTVGVLQISLIGAMAIQLRDAIGLDTGSLGLMFAAFFAAAAVLSAPVGRLAERVDPAAVLRVGCALSAAALLAASVASGVGTLLCSTVVAGVSTSLTRTTSSVLVARAIPPGRHGLALGVRNSAIPLAVLLAGVAVPTIALTIGWRWAFAIGAGLAATVWVLLPRTIPRPSRAGTQPRRDLTLRPLLGLAVAAGLASAAAASLGAFTAVTAVDAGIDEGTTGMLIAAGSVVGVASRIAVGWWTDRRPGSQLDVVVAMMLIGAAGYGLMAPGVGRLVWLAVPVAYAAGWAFYGSYYLSVLRLNPVAPGPALGIAQVGAFAGSIIGPVALGALAQRWSFTTAWTAAAAAAILAAMITAVVERGTRAGNWGRVSCTRESPGTTQEKRGPQ
jgi:predicted MFS family arabinose efflux permease